MFETECSFDLFAPSIFQITAAAGNDCWRGTGFTVGITKNSRRLILATARHVLEFPDDREIIWNIAQFDRNGKSTRSITFGSLPRMRGVAPHFMHTSRDVGVLILPSRDAQKRQFATDAEVPPNVIELKNGAGTGSRVGWAGYPNAINDTLGMPHLCYFEGVVSAMVDADNDKNIYVIDGHVARGVSGGPMWHWDDITKRWEICGIASQYQPFTDGMPGFCIFEPINPIIGFLLQDPRWQIDELKDTVVTGLPS